MAVGAHTVTEFANIMGLRRTDQVTFLAAVRCYAIRKEVLMDYASKRFVPVGNADYEVVTAERGDKRPPSPIGKGLSVQQVAQLLQMLAATKLENERPKAAAIPRLNRQQLERLIAESLCYHWMHTQAVTRKAYSATDANLDVHELAKAIWTVVHEELRNKRQGRMSHLPVPQNMGATARATSGTPLGRVVRATGGTQTEAQCYPPPLYKLRPCPSYSRRRDGNNWVRNFNCVQDVVRPHETWVCSHYMEPWTHATCQSKAIGFPRI